MRDIRLPAIMPTSSPSTRYVVEWRMKCGRSVFQPVYAIGIKEAYDIARRSIMQHPCCGMMTCESIIKTPCDESW